MPKSSCSLYKVFESMCGIFVAINRHGWVSPDDTIISRLRARGPDSLCTLRKSLYMNETAFFVTFASSVLSLRGPLVTKQPLVCEDTTSVFCWNGEAWKVGGRPIRQNDTKLVLEHLNAHIPARCDSENAVNNRRSYVEDFLSSIEGPFAFVFLDAVSSTIHFGRDSTGRRSLLMRHDNTGGLLLSSVGDDDPTSVWSEVPYHKLHRIHLTEQITYIDGTGEGISTSIKALSCEPQNQNAKQNVLQKESLRTYLGVKTLAEDMGKHLLTLSSAGYALLAQSLHLRLRDLRHEDISSRIDKRAQGYSRGGNNAERVGVLFSGGLDCSILARISHDIIPINQPIVLLNVAFENPRLATKYSDNQMSLTAACEACPDRITARKALDELGRTCLGREWKFVAINVAYSETIEYREEIISLMKPHGTEMDLSIAMALFFACRGEGEIAGNNGDILYRTPARILLSGLGADEIFGGYVRHENAYKRGGLQALKKEMDLDIARIGQRNLGRDDRVTAHWAREIRYPYLDEGFLRWALRLATWERCSFHVDELSTTSPDLLTDLEPGKFLLRLIAKNLGLDETSREKKRAIQFGSRSAKMLSGKIKGTADLSVAN